MYNKYMPEVTTNTDNTTNITTNVMYTNTDIDTTVTSTNSNTNSNSKTNSNSNTNTNTNSNTNSNTNDVPISDNNLCGSPIPMTDAVSSETVVQIPIASKIEGNTNYNNSREYSSFPTMSNTYYAEIPPEDKHLQKCWQYGKTVKYIACIDIFICILNSFISLPWLILLVGPLVGYYGAKEYNPNKILAYIIYCILLSITRIGILYGIYDGDFDSSSKIMSNGGIFVCWLSAFTRLWITWLGYKFHYMLKLLTKRQRSVLQIGTFVPVTTNILYY